MSLITVTHPNSKKVTIFRKPGGTQAQSDLLEYYALTSKALGSYFQPGGSQKSSSGMDFWEEDIIMPLLIDVPSSDKEFRRKVSTFNDDINTSVPYFEGRTLEIGMTGDNSKPISEPSTLDPKGNLPLSAMDYLRYRHAMGHPECAESKEDVMENMLKSFYIHDTTRENNTAYVDLEERDKALTAYLTLKSDPRKVEMHLSLLGKDVRGIAEKERLSLLRSLSEERAPDFIANVADKDNEERFFLNLLLTSRVMDLVGSSYMVKETGEVLGYSVKDVVEFFKNKANSALKGILKARLQESRKPVKDKIAPEVA